MKALSEEKKVMAKVDAPQQVTIVAKTETNATM